MSQQNSDYWLHKSSREAISKLTTMRAAWSGYATGPIRQAWVRNYIAYYSPVVAPSSWDTSLVFEGVDGELVRMYTPKARKAIQDLTTLITKQKLAFDAVAQTRGSDIVQDLKIGHAIGDQLVEMQRLNVKGRELCEGSLVTGAWFTKTAWRTDRGVPYTRDDNGTIIYTGAPEIELLSVFDVFYNVLIPHWEMLPYVECRTIKNRYDLIAQHPDLERELMALPSANEERGAFKMFGATSEGDDAQVCIYECYARPSPALPVGRMIVYGADDCVLYDDENKYRDIPIEPMMPEKVLNTGYGYPLFTSLAASQEMYDNSLSAVATNQAQYAVQSICAPRGAKVSVQDLNGSRFIYYTPQNVPGGGVPTPLQLSATAPETFKFSEILDKVIQDLSGVPSALKGDAPSGASGTLIATLSANALEFIAGAAMAYSICWEKTMMHAVNSYKNFSKVEQNVAVKGRNNQVMNRAFKGENLSNISGMKMQLSNPLMQTIAGRLEIAEKLLNMPKEMWPEYTSVIEGRPVTEIYRGQLSERDNINQENEFLQQGKDVPVLASDDHAKHMQEHAGLLNDPAVRLNGPTNQVILNHLLAHFEQSKTVDPMFTAMIRTGKMPDPAMKIPGGGGGGGGAPGGQPPGMPQQQLDQANPAQDLLNRGGG